MTSRDDLPVCTKCGWHALMRHEERCNPIAGRAAAVLIKACNGAGLPGTQLGYGGGNVVIGLDRTSDLTGPVGPHIKFSVKSNGDLSYDDLWWLQDFTPEQAAKVTIAIAKAVKEALS